MKQKYHDLTMLYLKNSDLKSFKAPEDYIAKYNEVYLRIKAADKKESSSNEFFYASAQERD